MERERTKSKKDEFDVEYRERDRILSYPLICNDIFHLNQGAKPNT